MAKFTMSKDFYPTVSEIVEPEVNAVAEMVEREAKRLAPGTKAWVSRRDAIVRPEHVAADAKYGNPAGSIPENLRFAVPSMKWDMENHNVGPFSYMMKPKDQDFHRYVTFMNCRCYALIDPTGVARHIKAKNAELVGTKVEAKVVAEREYIIQAEMGEMYPGGFISPGVFFMHKAASQTAARRRDAMVASRR